MLDRSLRRAGTVGAVLTAGAGAVHFAAAVPHFGESPMMGVGFAVVGWVQLMGAAVLLYRADRLSAATVASVNAGAIAAWGVSRTVGLPVVGPGTPEAVAWPDVVAVALEIGAIVALAAASRRGRDPSSTALPATATASALAVAVVGSVAAMAALGSGGHGHGPSSAQHASEGREEADGTDGAARTDTDELGHEHPDGSLHLHLAAPVHRHDDRTVHLHTGADSGSPSPDGSGHDHSHPDGHSHPE